MRKGIVDDNGQFTDKGKKIYTSFTGERFDVPPVEEWIDEYRDKWKAKVLGIGESKMGSKKSLIKKMKDFVRKHPEYDINIILRAADRYISQERRNNFFQFLQRADYFVEKDGGSRLDEFCEIVQDDAESTEQVFKTI